MKKGNRSAGPRFRVARRLSPLFNGPLTASRRPTSRFCEAIMRPLYRRAFAALFVICVAPPVDAQDNSRAGQPTAGSAGAPGTRTGKERLGQKWSDEQRVDNCKVPID